VRIFNTGEGERVVSVRPVSDDGNGNGNGNSNGNGEGGPEGDAGDDATIEE
jgi:hypothetical protein